jgi:hypothetical protein
MRELILNGRVSNYLISEKGDIFNKVTNKFRKPQVDKDGYAVIYIGNTNYKIHRLVAITYLDNPNNLPQINHIDNNRMNNHYSNLQWTTQQLNIKHKVVSGRNPVGSESCRAKLTESEVLQIRSLYENTKVSQKSLALKFGVSQMQICYIVTRKQWTHI